MKTYEPTWSSPYVPLVASSRKVPVPAPVTSGTSMPDRFIASMLSFTIATAFAIAASRSAGVRMCCAPPW